MLVKLVVDKHWVDKEVELFMLVENKGFHKDLEGFMH